MAPSWGSLVSAEPLAARPGGCPPAEQGPRSDADEHVPGVVHTGVEPRERHGAGGDAQRESQCRHHAFFTTVATDGPAGPDTVAADKTHHGHAIIEQVHADLKASALAHLPCGKFAANSAWLVLAVIAFNLTHTSATVTAAPALSKATATVRRKLIHAPARVASSARRITLHLPQAWPWQQEWTRLFDKVADPPATATS